MNLFRKLKLELYQFQQYFTSPTQTLKQGDSKTTHSPDTSQAHLSYAQKFLFVNILNRLTQCHISCPAAARMHQRHSHV